VIQFAVPTKPVSTNQAYRRRGNGPGFYMTDAAKAFKTAIKVYAIAAAAQHLWKRRKNRSMSLEITYWNIRKNADVDGPNKLVQDALQGVLFDNDNCVKRIASEIERDAGPVRVEITVREVTK
jgi:Holliday junction resolvase RusA-like endonuclease